MRPCFCNGGILVPSSLCPVHVVWPLIRARIGIHELLFPTLQGSNLNRILKAALAKAGFPNANRYTMYCFRRGCLAEMKRSKSTVGEIMKTAGWRTSQFKVYLDLHADEEAVILSLMRDIEFSDSESGIENGDD